MCFSSSPAPAATTTSTIAAPPPPPLPAALPQQLGSVAKSVNMAKYGNEDGPQTRIERPDATPTVSAVSGSNTNYSM